MAQEEPLAIRERGMSIGKVEVDQAGDVHDAEFAAWLSSLTERLQRGERLDLEGLCAERPRFEVELRGVWPVLLLTEMAASSAIPGTVSSTPAIDITELATSRLPATFGDFELIEEIGRGGMGIVYRARQAGLEREVALKLILLDHLASSTDRARFYAEARSAARLEHENIVPVYELGQVDGRPFICMKLIDGETLATRLMRGPLAGREAAKLLLPLCRAIQYAHDQSVLHRDIKPSNILLGRDGRPYLTDFGLAKDLSDTASLTRTGAVIGTPAYMSPEQAAGGRARIDATSDVYALGAVLYHMVTGQPPFVGRTGLETVLMVLEQDPRMPRSLHRTVDRDLEMIVMRCLQKPADLRYSSAAALADDLDAYLNDEEISARSGRFSQVIAQMFRETHHIGVLANWGLLWMWHSLILAIVCVATNLLQWTDHPSRMSYFLLWTVGLGTWAAVFWALRRRMGPVTFVERQIAHLWAASMIATATLFPIEALLGLAPLKLSPVVPLFAASAFLMKGAILSGTFYIQAVALFATSLLVASIPEYGHLIMGAVTAACFFIPGLRFHRARRRQELAAAAEDSSKYSVRGTLSR